MIQHCTIFKKSQIRNPYGIIYYYQYSLVEVEKDYLHS